MVGYRFTHNEWNGPRYVYVDDSSAKRQQRHLTRISLFKGTAIRLFNETWSVDGQAQSWFAKAMPKVRLDRCPTTDGAIRLAVTDERLPETVLGRDWTTLRNQPERPLDPWLQSVVVARLASWFSDGCWEEGVLREYLDDTELAAACGAVMPARPTPRLCYSPLERPKESHYGINEDDEAPIWQPIPKRPPPRGSHGRIGPAIDWSQDTG